MLAGSRKRWVHHHVRHRPVRAELSAEAIRLTRLLHRLVPEDTEMLALMLLTDARRPARTGPHGELVPLAEQDRGRWNRGLVAEGVALISRTLPRGQVGPYQLQAAIAAVHDEAEHSDATDWPQVLALYDLLEQFGPNPVVSLNRAVAVAMVQGPDAGLDPLVKLERDKRLAHHQRPRAPASHPPRPPPGEPGMTPTPDRARTTSPGSGAGLPACHR